MRGQRLFMGLALVATTALGACGTVANGGTQTVDVVVKGSANAYCTFTTSKFRNSATFPNKLTIERSKEPLHADCQGEQNRKVVFDIPSRMTQNGSLGNIVYGVLPGMAYDSATGALWEYPNPLIVDFREIGSGATVDWPDNKADAALKADTMGTAPIVAPQPLRMQPVMDEDLNPAPPAIKAPTPVSIAPMKATDEPEIIDAASLALKNKSSVAAGKMKPVASPEDDPAVMKARAEAEAKKKAAEEAKRKAAAQAAAKKKAEDAAKKAAAEAEAAKAQAATAAPAPMLPETAAPAPGEATTTTTTTTVVTPAPAATPAPATTTPAPATTSTTTTTTTTAPAEAPKSDMDKYLQGQ